MEAPLVRSATEEERIKALLAGKRGDLEFDYELWRSNISGEELEKIGTVESASVSLSNYRDHTWELGLNMREDQTLDLFADYAKLVVLLRDGEEWIRFPLGLYRFDGPRGSDSSLFTSWDLIGRSPEVLLMDDMADSGYKVAKNTGVLAAARAVMIARGIPPGRIRFPVTDKALVTDMVFSPFQDVDSCYWLRICNALLAAGGFYALWCDAEGYFTTREIEDSGERETAVVYGANGESPAEELIVDEIAWSYDDETFANKVTLYAGDANDSPPRVAVAELHAIPVSPPNSYTYIVVDPDSKVSYEALGGRFIRREPQVLQNIVSQAEAAKLVKASLRLAAGRELKLTIPTVPDPRREPREDYELDVRRADGTRLHRGKWRVTGWTLPLSNRVPQAMTHEVSRVVRG